MNFKIFLFYVWNDFNKMVVLFKPFFILILYTIVPSSGISENFFPTFNIVTIWYKTSYCF